MSNKKSKIKNATKIEKNGIIFKSKLELYCYDKLIENNITNFKYEEVKFELLEPFQHEFESYELIKKTKEFDIINNKIRSITYCPDFTCIDESTLTGWLIECKGYPNDGWNNKWKTFKQYLHENDYKITLYKPNNQKNILKTIELIKNKYYG